MIASGKVRSFISRQKVQAEYNDILKVFEEKKKNSEKSEENESLEEEEENVVVGTYSPTLGSYLRG